MPQAAAALSPGTLVLGRYRPVRPLGSGGSGSVWLARDEQSGLDVALKIVARDGTAGPRAEREGIAAAQLRHGRCLRAYALARDAAHVYITYEYVPGRTLRDALRAGDLGDRAAVEVVCQVLDGLDHAHARGIVHRDVKPANVLLAEGDEIDVRLLDFGLALMREEETLTASGDIPGTLGYISPERLRGETGGPEADVWGVGLLLWEALAGRHPFSGGTVLERAKAVQAGAPSLAGVRPDLPKAIVALTDRALAVDPKRRPPAAALASGLRRADGSHKRRRPQPVHRARVPSLPYANRIAPAAAAALFVGWTASALPFYPERWPLGLSFAAALLTFASARCGLALALAVPVFPLGNLSLGLAVVYAAVAAAWFVLCWEEPRSALFLTLGPLLAPLAALGMLPLAAQTVRSPVRRAAQVAAAVLAAGAVAAVGEVDGAGLAGSERPLAAGGVLWRALLEHRTYGLAAIALAACGLLLPAARARGLWGIAGFGAAMLALTLLPSPDVSALPFVAATWITCIGLAAEPFLRRRSLAPVLRPRRRVAREGA